MSRKYKTRSGATQIMPSLSEVEEMDADGDGWCLACGNVQPAEPDAPKYKCKACGAWKVYGAEELALMGLVDTTDSD